MNLVQIVQRKVFLMSIAPSRFNVLFVDMSARPRATFFTKLSFGFQEVVMDARDILSSSLIEGATKHTPVGIELLMTLFLGT
jgi:hypothetical protein